MLELAVSHSAFAAVVEVVAAIGVAVALILIIRHRDAFARERGTFWVFHGDTDTSPHQMPGARFEERHVIDPEPARQPAPSVPASGPEASRGRRTGARSESREHTPHP